MVCHVDERVNRFTVAISYQLLSHIYTLEDSGKSLRKIKKINIQYKHLEQLAFCEILRCIFCDKRSRELLLENMDEDGSNGATRLQVFQVVFQLLFSVHSSSHQ